MGVCVYFVLWGEETSKSQEPLLSVSSALSITLECVGKLNAPQRSARLPYCAKGLKAKDLDWMQ